MPFDIPNYAPTAARVCRHGAPQVRRALVGMAPGHHIAWPHVGVAWRLWGTSCGRFRVLVLTNAACQPLRFMPGVNAHGLTDPEDTDLFYSYCSRYRFCPGEVLPGLVEARQAVLPRCSGEVL